MPIQWFPGHMTSARKKAAETMANIDVVIEVLDARLPEASSNPLIHELRTFRQRPCLKLLSSAIGFVVVLACEGVCARRHGHPGCRAPTS